MEYCEHCDRPFKTVQGLLGHLRMKHNVDDGENSAEFGRDIEEPPKMQEVLEEIRTQLEDLEALANAAANPDHRHGGDGNCTKCHELLHSIRQRGIKDGAHSVLSLPGVREAITYKDWANERNENNPSSPVVGNWFDVPGVKEAISKYLYDEGEVVLRDEREVLEEEDREVMDGLSNL